MSEYIEHDSKGISVGLVKKQFYSFGDPPQELVLEGGSRLGPVTVAYETYGKLDAGGNNAVLVLHALSGDSHVAGYYSEEDPKPVLGGASERTKSSKPKSISILLTMALIKLISESLCKSFKSLWRYIE